MYNRVIENDLDILLSIKRIVLPFLYENVLDLQRRDELVP